MSNKYRIDENHLAKKKKLRVIGIVVLTIGVIFTVVGFASFFSAFNSIGRQVTTFDPFRAVTGGSPFGTASTFGRSPDLFWCAFIGLPLTLIGGVITAMGFMGEVARYQSQEFSPVARDTFNYMARGTKEGVKNVTEAVSEGLSRRETNNRVQENNTVKCHKCNKINSADAKFCNNCGSPIVKNKTCTMCGTLNELDAKFCDNCGNQFTQ